MPEVIGEIHTKHLERLFHKTKAEEVFLKVEATWKPRWEGKLCLRDTLQRIYDVDVKA